MINTQKIGYLNEMRFFKYCIEKDIPITLPIHHAFPFDCVIKIDNKWKAVQIKTIQLHKRKGRYFIELRRTVANKHKQYAPNSFDLVCASGEIGMWLIPINKLTHIKNNVTITKDELKKYKLY